MTIRERDQRNEKQDSSLTKEWERRKKVMKEDKREVLEINRE